MAGQEVVIGSAPEHAVGVQAVRVTTHVHHHRLPGRRRAVDSQEDEAVSILVDGSTAHVAHADTEVAGVELTAELAGLHFGSAGDGRQ